MHNKFIIAGLSFIASLGVLALIGNNQAQINNFKPFVVIMIVTGILGVLAYYQKSLGRF